MVIISCLYTTFCLYYLRVLHITVIFLLYIFICRPIGIRVISLRAVLPLGHKLILA